jgi:hypothetical protein
MLRKVAVLVLFAGLLALAGTANAAVYTSPTLEAYGAKTLVYGDLSFISADWGGGGYAFQDLGGSSYKLTAGSWGGEYVTYYAFKVPTGSAVSITGGQWSGTNPGWGAWAETMLWSSENLGSPLTGETPMTNSDWSGAWAGKTATDRWGAAGAYAAGFEYANYDGAPMDQFTAVWNYAANAQHFATVGGTGTNPASSTDPLNPFDPTIRGGNDSAWTDNQAPASLEDISLKTYTGTGYWNRIMQESEAPASGFPAWMVTAGTGAETEVCVVAKMGGDAGSSLTVSGLTFEIRGLGDANGDGAANVGDLTMLLNNYNKTAMGWTDGDFTGDGTVNVADLTLLLNKYNTTYGAATGAGLNASAVPEPSSIVLLATLSALLGAWAIRRRSR